MKFKDQLSLLPKVVILMFNIAVLVVFVMHFLNEDYSGIVNLYYFLLVCGVALIIFGLRILIVGQRTILDKYITKTKSDWIFILFISFVVSILINTWAIKYFSINPFLDFFGQDPTGSPLQWFNILNSNFHRLAFYTLAFIIVNYPVLYIFYKIKKYWRENPLETEDDHLESLFMILPIFGISFFILAFIADPMVYFWDKILNFSIIKNLLSFVFSGSLLFFNLFFLFKKNI